jgi:hypothetical protein
MFTEVISADEAIMTVRIIKSNETGDRRVSSFERAPR